MSKRYVGIDPSSKTGFFIQDVQGNTIYEDDIFASTDKDPERMIYITDTILSLLNIKTDYICIENFSYGSTGQGVSYQYGLGYMIREGLVRNGFEYYEVSPGGLKKFACGNGKAKKEVMVEPVKRRWGFYHPSDNITDAFILSEIAKALDMGKDYPNLKEHEKQALRVIKTGIMNQKKFKEIKPPSWKNPRSKYYFERKGE